MARGKGALTWCRGGDDDGDTEEEGEEEEDRSIILLACCRSLACPLYPICEINALINVSIEQNTQLFLLNFKCKSCGAYVLTQYRTIDKIFDYTDCQLRNNINN